MKKNTEYNLITGKQSVPESSSGTGTISTDGIVVNGTGTLFSTEMPKGSWLVDLSQNYMCQVDRVDSDTKAYLLDSFPVDLSSVSPDIIPMKIMNVVAISVQIPSGLTDGEIDGEVFPQGTSITFAKDRDHSAHRDLIDPIIVDGTGTQMQILILR